MDKIDWIEKSCNSCGECCMKNPLRGLIDKLEWKKIIEYLQENSNGLLQVLEFNPIICRFLKRLFKPKFNDLSTKSISKLFSILDNEANPCPFLDFDIKEAGYYCVIQAIKPSTCTHWFCNPLNFSQSDFNLCVLNFGNMLDYPYCMECQNGFDDENPGKINKPADCEMGKGCLYLERRIRFFLSYAKNHPKKKETIEFAERLMEILKKQDEIFRKILLSDLNLYLSNAEILMNLNKYADFISAIQSVLSYQS